MGKIIYYTKFKKPIVQGQEYFGVLKDGSVVKTTANSEVADNPNTIERFLSMTGAAKCSKAIIAELANKPVEVKPTEEELKEKEISKKKVLEQLDFVENEEDYKKWLERNNLKLATPISLGFNSNDVLGLSFKGSTSYTDFLIYFGWSIRGGFSCCGAREQGAHQGYLHSSHSMYLNEARLKTLSKYLAKEFEAKLRLSANNYGIVSYVVNPGVINEPSARIGFLLEASECFQKAGRFKNPNSSRWLDIYTVSDAWAQNK